MKNNSDILLVVDHDIQETGAFFSTEGLSENQISELVVMMFDALNGKTTSQDSKITLQEFNDAMKVMRDKHK